MLKNSSSKMPYIGHRPATDEAVKGDVVEIIESSEDS
jgi:hypothetical protein|tara:strand:- start:371 stop:481 length:111 start_codon:yes stop_codon:yes gene_type:complete